MVPIVQRLIAAASSYEYPDAPISISASLGTAGSLAIAVRKLASSILPSCAGREESRAAKSHRYPKLAIAACEKSRRTHCAKSYATKPSCSCPVGKSANCSTRLSGSVGPGHPPDLSYRQASWQKHTIVELQQSSRTLDLAHPLRIDPVWTTVMVCGHLSGSAPSDDGQFCLGGVDEEGFRNFPQ
jgi:hypothetical protein